MPLLQEVDKLNQMLRQTHQCNFEAASVNEVISQISAEEFARLVSEIPEKMEDLSF